LKNKDELVQSLILIAEHYKIATSATQLTAGLPLVDGRLTSELFIRAAEKIRFHTKLVTRSLDQISSLVLPAVLNLNEHASLVLLKIDHKKKEAETISADNVRSKISLNELSRSYAGSVFFISDNYKFDERSSKKIGIQNEHWF
jgi:ATP-binding cassette subfamily C protein LapB